MEKERRKEKEEKKRKKGKFCRWKEFKDLRVKVFRIHTKLIKKVISLV